MMVIYCCSERTSKQLLPIHIKTYVITLLIHYFVVVVAAPNIALSSLAAGGVSNKQGSHRWALEK